MIEGIYFDGISSAARQINLLFDNQKGCLNIELEVGKTLVWYLPDLQFERLGQLTEIRNRLYSGALLKIDNQEFSQQFYQKMKTDKRVNIHTRLSNLGLPKILLLALVLLGLSILSYIYVLPVVVDKAIVLVPNSFDAEIENVYMNSFFKHGEVNKEKTKYLQEFAANLSFDNQKKLKFMVVNSDDVNAFALPNGQIVVFSALLEEINSPDELVALLGHEASHVNHRHSTRMLGRNLAGYLIISAVMGDVNGLMSILGENAHLLQNLSYSRQFEEEADKEGLEIVIKNQFDPKGMLRLFECLERQNKLKIAQIISSHPLTDERIKNIRKIIAQKDYEIRKNEKLQELFEKMKE